MKRDIKIFLFDNDKKDGGAVYVGSDFNECLESVLFRDKTKENINENERIYHELIVQYWAWKNIKAEYYGFGKMNQKIDYTETYKTLDEVVGASDVILTGGEEYSAWLKKVETIHFKGLDNRYIVNVEDVYATVLSIYPDYADIVARFKREGKIYGNSNFIMKNTLFFEYCEILFGVLFDIEKKTDFSHFNQQELYVFSLMAEILFGVYIMKLKNERTDIRIACFPLKKEIRMKQFEHVYPMYSKNNVAIALSCNEQYMPILGVMLKSLLDNSGTEHNYDIIVMQRTPDSENTYLDTQKVLVKKLVSNYPNANIRFVDVSAIIDAESFYVHYNYTPETYFRLFLPQILCGYKKIVYMDADIIVKRDIAELYDTDLEGALIGAVRDPIINGTAKSTRWNMQYNMSELGIKNIYDYFQAGVLLIDIEEISKNELPKKMIDYAMTHECELVDQDVLNLFCQGRVKFIDNRWNVDMNPVAMEVVPAAPSEVWEEYLRNREEGYIYHFAGGEKPWLIPDMVKAEIFWEVARRTPWYEQLLANMMKQIISSQKEKASFDWRFPYELVKPGSNIAIYGAGNVGKSFKKTMSLSGYANVLLWVDRNYANLVEMGVREPEILKGNEGIDKVIIAINNIATAKEVREYLQGLEIDPQKIVWMDYSK